MAFVAERFQHSGDGEVRHLDGLHAFLIDVVFLDEVPGLPEGREILADARRLAAGRGPEPAGPVEHDAEQEGRHQQQAEREDAPARRRQLRPAGRVARVAQGRAGIGRVSGVGGIHGAVPRDEGGTGGRIAIRVPGRADRRGFRPTTAISILRQFTTGSAAPPRRRRSASRNSVPRTQEYLRPGLYFRRPKRASEQECIRMLSPEGDPNKAPGEGTPESGELNGEAPLAGVLPLGVASGIMPIRLRFRIHGAAAHADDLDRKNPGPPRRPRRRPARRQHLGRRRRPDDARRLRARHHRHLQAALRQGRQGLGPRQGRHHPRPLHLHGRQDGQPQRGRAAPVRGRAGVAVLLRRRHAALQGRLPHRPAGRRAHAARRGAVRHRQPHLHGRGLRRVRHRHRQHRRRLRHGHRQALGQGAADDAFRLPRRAAALPDGQGPDPGGHRRHRLRRRHLSGHGVRRRRRLRA